MGTTLTGKRVQNTYDSLLKLSDNDNLTGTAKIITDGLGNDSPLYLSGTRLGIGMSPNVQFQTSSNAQIGGNLVVGGNLTVNGTTTHIDSTIVEIGDNMIELAKDNVANIKDIGWYGTINDGTEKYVGVFYDASTGTTTPEFHIGLGTTEPDSTAAWTTKGKLVIGQLDATGATITGNLSVTGTIADSDGDVGTSGQVLSSTGSGTNWIDLEADTAKRLEVDVKNVFGSTMTKGTVVHAQPTGTLSGNVIEVVKADANVAANMPAIGILNEDLANNAEGKAVMFGTVQGIDTSSFSVGDELYVSTTAGLLTATKHTSVTALLQKVAIVVKSHATNGLIKVFGAGRVNDVPNEVDRDLSIAGTLKVDDLIEIEADSGYGRLEIGGPSGGYIDLKTPFSDDYDLRIITNSSGSEFTGAGDFNINAGNTLTLTLDGTTQAATFADNIDTAEDKRISVGAWDNSGFGSGQMYGFSVTSTTPLLHLTESDQTNKKGYIGLSGGNMYVGGFITNFYLQTGSGSTALEIDSNQDAHFIGNVELGDGADISMSAGADGQLQIDGNGYAGAIAIGASAMAIYHNSSSRNLILGTNETTALTIYGSNQTAIFSTNVGIGVSSLSIISGAVKTLSIGGTSTTVSGGVAYQMNGTLKYSNYFEGVTRYQNTGDYGFTFYKNNTTELVKIFNDGSLEIISTLDQILTLNQNDTGGWNYIGFESQSTRKYYLGTDANLDFVIGSDVGSEKFYFTGFDEIDFNGAYLIDLDLTNAGTSYDKYLVADSNNQVKYRTKSEIISDLELQYKAYSGGDRTMHVWEKIHATYSDDSGANTYWVIHTRVPQNSYSMGGFELIFENDYNDDQDGGFIRIYGYWNPESNGGFIGFKYTSDNPNLDPTIQVGVDSNGYTVFIISGEDADYTQLIAKNLWLGYQASSASSSWGDNWSITTETSISAYSHLDTLAKHVPFGGSGTTNYVAKWSSSNNLTNSVIYDDGTRIGIGLTPNTSYSNLQVKTPSTAYGLDLVGRDAGSLSENQITFWNSAQNTVLAAIYNSSNSLYFYTNGANRLILDNAGNIKTANRIAFRETYHGYSSTYKVVQYGSLSSTSGISLGYDPISNTSGNFNGNNIFIPNNRAILAPSNADNNYYGVMMFNSDDDLLVGATNYNINSTYILRLNSSGNSFFTGRLFVKNNTAATTWTGLEVATGMGATNGVNGSRLLYLYNDGITLKLDAYDYGQNTGLTFELGGNGGDVYVAAQMGIKTTPYASYPLSIAASSTASEAVYQQWTYNSGNTSQFYMYLKQVVTSGVVRYSFGLVNNYTNYDNIFILDRGKIGIYGVTNPSYPLHVGGNTQIDYHLLGRGIRSANRGELHLNATGTTDVSEIFFGYGSGYTEANIRWGISDRGTSDGVMHIYQGPANGGFKEIMTFDASLDSVGINKPSGLNAGGFGSPKLVIKQDANSDWGGVNIEAQGNDSVFSFSSTNDSHIIAGSYRTSAGYKPITMKTAGAEAIKIDTSGNVRIGTSGTAYGGSGITSLTIINNSYPTLSLGSTTDYRWTMIAYSSYIMYQSSGSKPHWFTGGNVGVNDSNPGYKFVVNGTAGLYGTTYMYNSSLYAYNSSYNVYLRFSATDGNYGTIDVASGKRLILQSSGGGIGFFTTTVNSISTGCPALNIGSTNASVSGGIILQANGTTKYYQYYESNLVKFQGTSGVGFQWQTNNSTAIGSLSVGGTFTVIGDVVAYGSPSDIRLKENIKPIENALDKVEKLQGVKFDWKESDSILKIKEDYGFIAQDVEKVIPELVRTKENGMKSLRHQGITPILLEAIKELKAEIEDLKKNNCKCNCK